MLTHADIIDLCQELIEHLEYIGWGDSWEREGAVELMERARKFQLEYPTE